MKTETKRENSNKSLLNIPIADKTIGKLLLLITAMTVFILIKVIFSPETDFKIADAAVLTYFTVQTNILICIWMIATALYIFTGRHIYKWAVNMNIAASFVTYMLVNSIIFWFIMVPTYAFSSGFGMLSIPNVWLHTMGPILSIIIIQYIGNAFPPQKNVKRKLIPSLIYPTLYILHAVSMALRGVYLYPMLNPSLVGGWIGVAICMSATLAFIALLYLIIVHQIKNHFEE